MAAVQDGEDIDHRTRLAENCCQRRAADAHRGESAIAEDEDGVQDGIGDEAHTHPQAGQLGVAHAHQQVAACHRQRRGETPEIPDVDICDSLTQCLAGGALLVQCPGAGQHSEYRNHDGDETYQDQPVGDQPRGTLTVARADFNCGSAHYASGKPAKDAPHQHYNREGVADCRQRNLSRQPPDEVGVHQVVAAHRGCAGEHRQRSLEHRSADGSLGIIGFFRGGHFDKLIGIRPLDSPGTWARMPNGLQRALVVWTFSSRGNEKVSRADVHNVVAKRGFADLNAFPPGQVED